MTAGPLFLTSSLVIGLVGETVALRSRISLHLARFVVTIALFFGTIRTLTGQLPDMGTIVNSIVDLLLAFLVATVLERYAPRAFHFQAQLEERNRVLVAIARPPGGSSRRSATLIRRDCRALSLLARASSNSGPARTRNSSSTGSSSCYTGPSNWEGTASNTESRNSSKSALESSPSFIAWPSPTRVGCPGPRARRIRARRPRRLGPGCRARPT